MDLWTRIEELRKSWDRRDSSEYPSVEDERALDHLIKCRNEERESEVPVPFCCAPIAGARAVFASRGNPERSPVWRANYGGWSSCEVFHCPFCGTKLPALVKKATPPPHLCLEEDDQYCGACRRRYLNCVCSYAISAWEAENAPPIEAVAAVVMKPGVSPYEYLSVSRKYDPNQKGFPGGRIEAGETPEQAMCRELLEETGLTAVEYHRALDVLDDYPIRAIFFRVTAFTGEISTKEKGVVEWVEDTALIQSSPFRRSNTAMLRKIGVSIY